MSAARFRSRAEKAIVPIASTVGTMPGILVMSMCSIVRSRNLALLADCVAFSGVVFRESDLSDLWESDLLAFATVHLLTGCMVRETARPRQRPKGGKPKNKATQGRHRGAPRG